MPKLNIVLATTTWYSPDNPRLSLALKMAREAGTNGYPLVVVDNSVEEVRQTIQKAGAIVHPQAERGMGKSRRQVFREALRLAGPNGIVVWLEPEKYTFVPLIAKVCEPFEQNPDLDLVIPRRRSLETYPIMQQHAEELGREGFRLATGRALDIWAGPAVFRARVAHYYLDYKGPPDRWDSLVIPAALMVTTGRKVDEVVVDYHHPPEQLEENTFPFYEKRIEQLTVITESYRNHLNLN